MPLFGEKRDQVARDRAARLGVDWINSAPPADLAVELMAPFGDGTEWYALKFCDWLDIKGDVMMPQPIVEALQLLEHSELVYMSQKKNAGFLVWGATRLGLATLDNGKDAVRQRIRDRTGL